MSEWSDKFTRDLYNGVWRWMVPWLKVPKDPPGLPRGDRDALETFKPARGFLSYLKFWFLFVAIVIDLALLAAWIVICIANLVVGLALIPLLLIIMFVPDVIVFVAIHIRYDATWYAMTDRSIRIRRGVWVIHETTISFENVQNVKVRQGPVQRHFGIANVIIETAGSGGGHERKGFSVSNQGLIEGIEDAARIRDLIMKRLRAAKGAGLGDDADRAHKGATSSRAGWSPAHLAVLREIRDTVVRM